jgi:glycogen debranching enzyme
VPENAVPRATPANPMPGVTVDESIPSTEPRKLLPELGPDAVAVVDGRTFMYSNSAGDVLPGTIGGLVRGDTRLLSKWLLTINGASPLVVQSRAVEHYGATFFLANPELSGLKPYAVEVRRLRVLGNGMRERIEVRSFDNDAIDLELRLAVGNDFADIFEIKDRVRDRSDQISRDHAADNCRLLFQYRNGDFEAHTIVDAYPNATAIEGDDLVWRIRLAPHDDWHCELDVPLQFSEHEETPPARIPSSELALPASDPINVWRGAKPQLHCDSDLVTKVYEATARDLLALRIGSAHPGMDIVLAAGLPWFLTEFARDAIITAYQTLSFGPEITRSALLKLVQTQGRISDDFKDEEPGKILHEYRTGELTSLGQKPHNPYYGAVDTTPLWLILLSEYWRWTEDDSLVVSLRDQALAALTWINEYGDRDGDGYVEYQTRSPAGLGNQCWRDSWDGVQFADGSIPVLPIATCETQGYVYDAKLRLAELADGPLGDQQLASRLRTEADHLQERFNEDFWIDERGGYYAIGLDGEKNRIDSLTSNIGQLLWSGIVPQERAQTVVDRLMSDELFSGWGVRTMSTMDTGYNPIGYHHGTVWPHDNSIIVAGLTRYGYREQANRITMALLEAAATSEYRLPEALSGHPRASIRSPVRYPTACSPQAWASGAPLLCLRSMLGLSPRAGQIDIFAHLPDDLGELTINGLRALNHNWDIKAIARTGRVRLAS